MTTFVLKNLRQLFDKYAVARTEHNALVKSTTRFYQILWPSQKTQTLQERNLQLTVTAQGAIYFFSVNTFGNEKSSKVSHG